MRVILKVIGPRAIGNPEIVDIAAELAHQTVLLINPALDEIPKLNLYAARKRFGDGPLWVSENLLRFPVEYDAMRYISIDDIGEKQMHVARLDECRSQCQHSG